MLPVEKHAANRMKDRGEDVMNQVILVAHGRLATEMKNSAEMLFGELTNFHAIDFLEGEGLDSLSGKIYNKLKALNSSVLIFTDLFGGTPFNASCSVLLGHPEQDVEIVSGMSLPLVLELAALIDRQSIQKLAFSLPRLVGETVRLFDKELTNNNQDEEDF